jgi:hypothetical protein
LLVSAEIIGSEIFLDFFNGVSVAQGVQNNYYVLRKNI